MAKETKRDDPPAYIDYEGAKAASESANHGNAFADCKRYWQKALFKRFKVAGTVWGLKEQTNLSRLLGEYGPETVKAMIDEWVSFKDLKFATSFGLFYKERYILVSRTTPKDYEW